MRTGQNVLNLPTLSSIQWSKLVHRSTHAPPNTHTFFFFWHECIVIVYLLTVHQLSVCSFLNMYVCITSILYTQTYLRKNRQIDRQIDRLFLVNLLDQRGSADQKKVWESLIQVMV